MNKLLTASEVCKILRVSPATLRRAFTEDRVPRPIRVGKRGIRWRTSDLQEWIDGQETTAAGRY